MSETRKRHPREKLGVYRIHPVGKDIHIDALRRHVERVEFAGSMLTDERVERGTTALILLDQISETLMYLMIMEKIRHDEFISRISPPKLNRKERKALLWNFDEKVEFLLSEGVVGNDDAAIISIAHEYRNPAYHRDISDGVRDRVVASLLLPSIGVLMERCYGGVSMSIDSHREWVEQFMNPVPSFPALSDIASAAGNWLTKSFGMDLDSAHKILDQNLQTRYESLLRVIEIDFLGPEPLLLTKMMIEEEFWANFDDEQAESSIRRLRYAIVAGEDVSKENYEAAEQEYVTAQKKAMETFVPTLSADDLHRFPDRIEGELVGEDRAKLLQTYEELDLHLREYEDILESAAVRLDHAIQREIDIRRGK